MNDPNGLFYDEYEEQYHLYYQYNPNDTVWGQPLYWGHATSEDLLEWHHHDPAIGPDHDDEGIFSGSIVVDFNNTSGLFDDSIRPEQRVVAIYTNNIPGLQTQDIAISTDGGYTFDKYEANPVLNVNSSQFRDPKVIWHEESQKWVMTLAKSQEYKIQIYTSPDLKNWELGSNFTGGYLGYQYECPGLFKAKVENPKGNETDEKWIMVLAINPGSPLGGSINEYFIGDFDGETFTPMDHASRFMDTGKDFYAFQAFNNVRNSTIGLAWASNWQYANKVPDDDGYRSTMSSVREYTLRYVSTNPETEQLILCQKPFWNDDSLNVVDEYSVEDVALNKSCSIKTSFENSTGLLDFDFEFSLNNTADADTFELRIFSSKGDEAIKLGFDVTNNQYYLNRHTSNFFQRTNQFFQERWSTYVEPLGITDSGKNTYQVYGVVDKSILELYFNNGAYTSTNTFFLEKGVPGGVELVTDSSISIITVDYLKVRELSL
jgi:beta-fructofuranosidase